jgi:parallel beta-helix repeat protein
MERKWLVVGIILLFVGTCIIPAIAQNTEKSQTSRGNWLYVGGSGPGNYSKIQDAINDASDGDTIIVFNGTYHEDILVDKQLSLLGINFPTLKAHSDNYNVLTLTANNCIIDNFKITNNYNYIRMNSNNNIIKNCSITAWIKLKNASFNYLFNNKISLMGIDAFGNSNNNNFSTNNISSTGYPSHSQYSIHISQSRNNIIFNNIFFNNWRGINLEYTINTTLLRNHFFECGVTLGGNNITYLGTHTMKENYFGNEQLQLYYYVNKNSMNITGNAGQVFLINCSHCVVSDMNVSGLDDCITLYFSSNNIITNNVLQGIVYDILLYNSSSNIISNNRINGTNYYGIYFDHSHNNTIHTNSLLYNPMKFVWSNDNSIVSNSFDNRAGIDSWGDRNKFNDNIIYTGYLDVGGYSNSLEHNIISHTSHGIWLGGENNIISGNDVSNCSDTGITDWGAFNVIQNNIFKHNNLAIQLLTSQDTITKNQIQENQQGILIVGSKNIIMNNNFILNVIDASFQTLFNHWLNNYWDRPLLHPKIISGKLIFYKWYTGEVLFVLPWFNLDLRPRLLPVNIN